MLLDCCEIALFIKPIGLFIMEIEMINIFLFIWLVRVASITVPTPPSFKNEVPREKYFIVEDHPVILECPAYAEVLKISWEKNGRELTITDMKSRFSVQHLALVISKPIPEDEGIYRCKATNYWGTAVSDFIHLKRAVLNPFPTDVLPEQIVVNEGESFSIPCHIPTGSPEPSVFWVIKNTDGTLASINDSQITMSPNGYLHFTNVKLTDGGKNKLYTCSVFSSLLHEYKLGNFVLLKVMASGLKQPMNKVPVQLFASSDMSVLKGKEVQLHCIFGGVPLPSVQWIKTKGQFPKDRILYINFGKTLHLFNIQYEDEDTYECIVKNGIGPPVTHTITLTVEASPEWITKPKNVNVTENENHTFTCLAAGKPEPIIQWFINGSVIKDSFNPRLVIDQFNLTIISVKASDTGTYQCNVSNTYGYIFTNAYLNTLNTRDDDDVYNYYKDINLNASQMLPLSIAHLHKRKHGHKRKLIRREKSLIIVNPPENLLVRGGETAMFKCGVSSTNNMTIIVDWEKDGKAISFQTESRYFKTDNYLVISGLKKSDTGKYTCIAQDSVNSVKASADLIVLDVPIQPTNIEVDCSSKAALLTWQTVKDNQHTPLLNYIIQYNTTFDPNVWMDYSKMIPATETSAEVPLSPWSNYTFRVLAWNRIGSSLPSGVSKVCSTPPDIPYKNPENVQGRGTTPNNLVISWMALPQIDHNSPGLYYVVNYKKSNIPGEWKQVEIFDWKNNSLTLLNTGTYQPYDIRVWAHNEKGRTKHEANIIKGYSGEDVPSEAPQNLKIIKVMGPKTARLSWDHVNKDSLNGEFVGYKIQTWVKGEPMTRMQEVFYDANVNSAVLDFLRPDSDNEVRILAYNGKYEGPASQILEIKTPQGIPGPVRSLSVLPLGSADVYLSWEEPEETNGKLIGYKVFYREVFGLNLMDLQERPGIVPPKRKTAKITGLAAGTSYRVVVKAQTSAGLGLGSFAEVKTENAMSKLVEYAIHLPAEPEFEITDIDKDFVQVRWIPGLIKGQRPGNRFYVKYKKTDESVWVTTPVETLDDYEELKNLESSTEYSIKVVSVEGAREKESAEKRVLTLNPRPQPSATNNNNNNNNNESYKRSSDDVSAVAIEAWLIGVICAVIIIVIFLIIITIVVIRRKRGRTHTANGKQTTQSHLEKADAEAKEKLKPSEDEPDITKE